MRHLASETHQMHSQQHVLTYLQPKSDLYCGIVRNLFQNSAVSQLFALAEGRHTPTTGRQAERHRHYNRDVPQGETDWLTTIVWFDETTPCAQVTMCCGTNIKDAPVLASSLSVCNTVYANNLPAAPIMQLHDHHVSIEPVTRIHGQFSRLPYVDDEDSDTCFLLIASELEAPGGLPRD